MARPEGKLPHGIVFFSVAEIFIGWMMISIITFTVFLGAFFNGSLLIAIRNLMPFNVFLFIFTTAIISAGLGVGLLLSNRHAYHMLLFFASMIILSKVLIFAGIISLNTSLETHGLEPLKNILSLIYHCAILVYFNLPGMKERFK